MQVITEFGVKDITFTTYDDDPSATGAKPDTSAEPSARVTTGDAAYQALKRQADEMKQAKEKSKPEWLKELEHDPNEPPKNETKQGDVNTSDVKSTP